MARLLLLAVVAALMLAASGSAATIDDLRALGYDVHIQFQTATCTNWVVSGFGISNSALGCEGTPDFQAAVDSVANPPAHCNRVWQYSHPDQYAAFNSITNKGYGVSGDQCADSYNITDKSGATVYSGSGAGLPGFDANNGPAPQPSPGTTTPSAPGASSPQTCLPLCPTPKPGDARSPSDQTSSATIAPSSSMEPGYTLDALVTVTSRIIQRGTAVPI